jgi:cell division protein FtsQ
VSRAAQQSLLPQNRRVERASDPGEDPPRDDARPDKKRKRKKRARRLATPGPWLQRLSLFTGIIVVVAASLLVAWGLRRYLRTSPRFSVRVVQVEGNARRTPHQIAQRAGIETGMNIFEIDEQAALQAIGADPWIAQARVSTDLPSSVSIVVVERDARALAAVGGSLYLVDTGGEIFKELDEGDPHELPVVTGIDSDAIARDREAVTQRVRRALELCVDLEEAEIAKRYPIQEVHIAPDTGLTVTVGTDALALAFGTPPYRVKIAKAKRILGELRHLQVKPAVVFLDNEAHPERVVVRMR